MRQTMRDRVAVVTGASSGIGRATAQELAARGAAVIVCARREDPLKVLAGDLEAAGADALAVPVDVTDADAVEALARKAVGRFGKVDLWVNNAAVNLFARVELAPVEQWHRVVETNLFGCYHGARAVIPWFREQGSGVLVNVGSILSKVPSPYQSAYVASKHAIAGLSDALRQEVRDVDDVHVCTVLPGAIDTPLFQHAGNHTGREVKPPNPVIDARRVAAAIVRCGHRPRREVVVGASTRQGLLANRLAPALTERAAAAAMEQDHFLEAHAQPTSGNVLEPVEEGTDVDGGWQDRDGSTLRTAALVGAGATAVAYLARRIRE